MCDARHVDDGKGDRLGGISLDEAVGLGAHLKPQLLVSVRGAWGTQKLVIRQFFLSSKTTAGLLR